MTHQHRLSSRLPVWILYWSAAIIWMKKLRHKPAFQQLYSGKSTYLERSPAARGSESSGGLRGNRTGACYDGCRTCCHAHEEYTSKQGSAAMWCLHWPGWLWSWSCLACPDPCPTRLAHQAEKIETCLPVTILLVSYVIEMKGVGQWPSVCVWWGGALILLSTSLALTFILRFLSFSPCPRP